MGNGCVCQDSWVPGLGVNHVCGVGPSWPEASHPLLSSPQPSVQAALAAFDPRLSFSIRLCFLSPSSSSSLDSPYTLVRGGCPAHPDVSLHPPHKGAAGPALPPGSQELQRLSFLLRPLYNDSIQFLHCRLALCTQEPQGQAGAYGGALPKCGPQAGACPSSRVGEPGSGRFQHTFTKPIIVTVGRLARATKPTPGTDPFPVPFPLAGRRGKALKEAPRPEQGETPLPPFPRAWSCPPWWESSSQLSSSASLSLGGSGSFTPGQLTGASLSVFLGIRWHQPHCHHLQAPGPAAPGISSPSDSAQHNQGGHSGKGLSTWPEGPPPCDGQPAGGSLAQAGRGPGAGRVASGLWLVFALSGYKCDCRGPMGGPRVWLARGAHQGQAAESSCRLRHMVAVGPRSTFQARGGGA
ncbi:transforming growth factor-beta receptor type 3-like protein [Mauremys mutica]|uniref:transforming growth factor-beta receptor type 3-like protein n=1 Tax=Mauremys mutica TaxID=74926 RepID=UPI001D16552A|nr:transforming growth factor-beta receptor type 3-like protein [Mauremys mutica]